MGVFWGGLRGRRIGGRRGSVGRYEYPVKFREGQYCWF